jgi:hypothetical protein
VSRRAKSEAGGALFSASTELRENSLWGFLLIDFSRLWLDCQTIIYPAGRLTNYFKAGSARET